MRGAFRSRVVAFALGAALALVPPAAGAATDESDAATIERVEDYLNAITTLRAGFLQVAPDGTLSEGTLYIARPGRLRLEYAPPLMIVIVSDGYWLTYVDQQVGQVSQTPVNNTPAGVLVRDNVRFGDDIVVTAIERDAAVLRITLAKTGNEGGGSITLVFTEKPFDLRQWVVLDPQGLETRVTLFDAQRGVEMDPALFMAPPPFPEDETGR